MIILKSLLKRMGYFVIIFIGIVAIYIMSNVASTTTFLASSNYDSSISREVGYLDDMDYDLRVPGEILTVEVYNDYEIACLTSFGAIFVNGNEGSIRYLIEIDDRASFLKEITLYKDKAKKRQVVVLDSSQSLSDKEKKLYQKLIDRVDKRLPTYVDVNREPKWLQVLRSITGNDKSLI